MKQGVACGGVSLPHLGKGMGERAVPCPLPDKKFKLFSFSNGVFLVHLGLLVMVRTIFFKFQTFKRHLYLPENSSKSTPQSPPYLCKLTESDQPRVHSVSKVR